jgi:hypothetical protein
MATERALQLPRAPGRPEGRPSAETARPAGAAAWLLAIAAVAAFGAPLTLHATDQWMRSVAQAAPLGPFVPLPARLWDQTPIQVVTTAAWRKIPTTVTVDRVRSDPSIWRRMFVDDFDRLPEPLRAESLEAMWRRYGHLVHAPAQWDRMTPRDWDLVPQPVRAWAFVEMVRYWSGYYQTGASFGLPRGTVTNTMAAILMIESGFVHRARYTNGAGNRDIGLAQASDWTRAALPRLKLAGTIDFAPEREGDYDDPWQATRVLVIWFALMLDETRGDLDAAIRAYNRGAPLARAGAGADYHRLVVDRRRRYFRDESTSVTWEFFRDRTAALARP